MIELECDLEIKMQKLNWVSRTRVIIYDHVYTYIRSTANYNLKSVEVNCFLECQFVGENESSKTAQSFEFALLRYNVESYKNTHYNLTFDRALEINDLFFRRGKFTKQRIRSVIVNYLNGLPPSSKSETFKQQIRQLSPLHQAWINTLHFATAIFSKVKMRLYFLKLDQQTRRRFR